MLSASGYNGFRLRPGSTMLKPFLRTVLPAMLIGACGLPVAHADIYTWTDESGRINISNLTPPDGARVTKVMRENKAVTAALDTAREAAVRESLREAEVRALAERVRQLQNEVEAAKRTVPQQVEYRVPPAPQIIQYFPPPEPQYAAAPPVYGGCDFGFDCGFGWGSGFYPGGYVVVGSVHNRRGHPGRGGGPVPKPHFPGGGHTAPWSPIQLPGTGRGH
jgi:hypothetical protein